MLKVLDVDGAVHRVLPWARRRPLRDIADLGNPAWVIVLTAVLAAGCLVLGRFRAAVLAAVSVPAAGASVSSALPVSVVPAAGAGTSSRDRRIRRRGRDVTSSRTSSITAIGALSPLRGPILVIRV